MTAGRHSIGPTNVRGVADHPSPVVTDLSMPRVTGVQLISEVWSRPDHCDLPVVVLTNSSSESDVTLAFQAGANSYVVKPRDLSHLATLMESLLGDWTDVGVKVWTP